MLSKHIGIDMGDENAAVSATYRRSRKSSNTSHINAFLNKQGQEKNHGDFDRQIRPDQLLNTELLFNLPEN